MKRFICLCYGAVVAFVFFGVGEPSAFAGIIFTNLFSFSQTNGYDPRPRVVLGTNGVIYGTTSAGGRYDAGTAFSLESDGSLKTMVVFDGTNGRSLYGGLIRAKDGNFYGTAYGGGSKNMGTVFRLTVDGVFATLIEFAGTNGDRPNASLMQASDGDLYGTTVGYLSGPRGTVFKLATNGTLTTLVWFNGTNGANPLAEMVRCRDGSLLGTTTFGGINPYGPGTIFRINRDDTFETIYQFNGNDGSQPRSTLMEAPDGTFYGVTSEGGGRYAGNVFRVSLPILPIIESTPASNGGLGLAWNACGGQNYQVQFCSDLFSPNWSNLGESITATNGRITVGDSIVPAQQRFYRVVLLP